MAWYSKYLVAFEKPYHEISASVKAEISDKIQAFCPEEVPECSVVLIAHNEERHILGCLWSLVDNKCDFSVEIIVVSNNSTDATENILEETGVCWYNESQKGPGFARQCGLEHARGKYHICIDSDTLYPPHYIATHVRHLKRTNVVCAYGLWSFLPDANHSRFGLFFYELSRDIYLSILNMNRPELCVRGMVLSFHTELGKKSGYRTNILRGEDGMMAFELKKYGKLKLLKTRKVRVITCNNTLDGGGNLMKNLWSRFKKIFYNSSLFFTTQKKYEDKESNLIKKS